MNYYIQGNKEKAEEIKAAFEKLGYDISWPEGCANPDVINIGVERNGAKYVVAETSEYIKDIIKTHPDYKELELAVKSKFKVGDWIVRNNGSSDIPIQVYGLKKDRYLVTNMLGSKGDVMLTWQDKWHIWTINDARPGDILNANGAVFIYKRHNKDYVYHYCGINLGNEFVIGTDDSIWNANNEIYPATQEQKDLLFKRIKETGYIWDLNSNTLTNKTKFKIGDWVIRNDGYSDVAVQIYNIKKDRYLVTNMLGSKGQLMINRQDEWRLWAITDAKDGDVLAADECYVIFKEIDGLNIKCY